MTIKKIYDNWYQARQLLNEKVFWGYGRTPNEAEHIAIEDYLKGELDSLDLKLYDDLSDYEKGKKDILNILFKREKIS